MHIGKAFDLEYGGLSKRDLLKKLHSSNILLNEFAKTIFSSELFSVSNQRQQISVIVRSIRELGFSKGATIPQIEQCMQIFKLSECPIEVAPYLRLYLRNQKEINEETKHRAPFGSLTIFSTPLTKDDNFPKGFYLRKCSGRLWLRGYCCSLDHIWDPYDELVFQVNS